MSFTSWMKVVIVNFNKLAVYYMVQVDLHSDQGQDISYLRGGCNLKGLVWFDSMKLYVWPTYICILCNLYCDIIVD